MEQRFEHTSGETTRPAEYTAPPFSREIDHAGAVRLKSALCEQAREALPSLLENDVAVSPERAAAIYGHLSVCTSCTREYEELNRVINLLENLTPPEMTMDFSGLIMNRILSEFGSARLDILDTPPAESALTGLSEEPVVRPFLELDEVKAVSDTAQSAVSTTLHSQQQTQNILQNMHASALRAETYLRERLLFVTILLAVLVSFLSTGWGRELLGVNLVVAGELLGRTGEVLAALPLIGGLFAFVFNTLAQLGTMLSDTYQNLGTVAVEGMALDLALGAGVCYLVIRRQRRSGLRY